MHHNALMNRISLRLFFLLLALVLTAAPAWAEEDAGNAFIAAENHMLALINAARTNPIQAMLDCGIDPDAVIAAFPGDADLLAGGMAPVADDARLKAAAAGHTADMLTGNFYGHDGSGGSTYEERIEANAYDAVLTGETLGFISFFNYIDPIAAAENIFRNMLRDELNPALVLQRNILNPEMKDVGIAVGSGQVAINQRGYNAYMVTCDFGSDVTENITEKGAESTLMILINQARMRPLDVAASLGVNVDAIQAADPEGYARWAAGMAPVGKNDLLTAAAKSHTRDMAVHAYVSHLDRFGKDFQERASENGYGAEAPVGERLGFRIIGDAAILSEEIQRLFETVIYAEFAAPPAEAVILNPQYLEAGIGLALSTLDVDGGLRKALILTIELGGAPDAPLRAEGWVYRDRNGDGLYSMGEGVFGIPINGVGYERPPGEPIPSAIPYETRMSDGAGRYSIVGASRMLQIWADTAYRFIGNVEAGYRDLVFEIPAEGL